jgi:5-methylcytosine-specific restriction endonuclease McrA
MLSSLISRQGNKCYYCSCEMNQTKKSPNQATVEHLIDKWSSPKHHKIECSSNLVAACYQCNNSRGAVRNRIARAYYKTQAAKKSMKLAVASTSSRQLYSLFGPVPQNLFVMKEIENA